MTEAQQPPRFSELLTASRFYLELTLAGGNDTADATLSSMSRF